MSIRSSNVYLGSKYQLLNEFLNVSSHAKARSLSRPQFCIQGIFNHSKINWESLLVHQKLHKSKQTRKLMAKKLLIDFLIGSNYGAHQDILERCLKTD